MGWVSNPRYLKCEFYAVTNRPGREPLKPHFCCSGTGQVVRSEDSRPRVNIIESHKIVKQLFCRKIIKLKNDGTDDRKIKYKKMAEIPV